MAGRLEIEYLLSIAVYLTCSRVIHTTYTTFLVGVSRDRSVPKITGVKSTDTVSYCLSNITRICEISVVNDSMFFFLSVSQV